MRIEAPYFSYADVGTRAQTFLVEHHPSMELPIPIEEIIDVGMGLDIFPFPRLYIEHGLEGFLGRNGTTIYVDKYQYNQLNEKYRYTLAHELGHLVLHRSVYKDLPFRTPDEYDAWRLSIPDREIEWFEKQGHWFAEQTLVPSEPLHNICREVVEEYGEVFSRLKSIPDDAWSYISNKVARPFAVNPIVVEIRIRRENIASKIPLRG